MAGFDHHLVPAIVLGCEQTGLGALRCLQIAGVPAYVACPPGGLVTRSRWYRPTPGPTAWDGAMGAQAADNLRAIPLAEAVLIPGADDVALWLADLPHDELNRRFRVSTSPRQSLEILQDKVRFGEFLVRAGIAHPRTFPIGDSADIDAIPFEQLDRVFIKPANSQLFNQILGAKGLWVRSRKEMEDVWRKVDGQGFKVMAQEYIPGTSSDHYFIDGFRDREGVFTGLFARRRIRIFPADFGNSSYCLSIPLTEVQGAVDNITRLLSALNYRGIFSAEFKRDARDGEFRILEVNTRAWWYVEFAARCGVNVCQMAYQDARGLPVTIAARNYPAGIGCVNLYGDIKSVLSQSRASRIPVLKTLVQWATAHLLIFRFDDPGPGLAFMGRLWDQRRHRNARRVSADEKVPS